MEALMLNIRGIKCDATDCDYQTDEEISDYESWLDKPCPKCGASLLTPEDLAAVKLLRATAEYVSALAGPIPDGTETVFMPVGLNGTGEIKFGGV